MLVDGMGQGMKRRGYCLLQVLLVFQLILYISFYCEICLYYMFMNTETYFFNERYRDINPILVGKL